MGLSSIIGFAFKYIPWEKVANAAVQYAPEVLKMFKDKTGSVDSPVPVNQTSAAETSQFHERFEFFEKTIHKQNETIAQLVRKLTSLEDRYIVIHSRMVLLMAMTGVTTVIAVGLLFVLFVR